MRVLRLEPRTITRRRPVSRVEPLRDDGLPAVLEREPVERRLGLVEGSRRREPVVVADPQPDPLPSRACACEVRYYGIA